MSVFLWVIVPYLCLATFVVGHVWRYRYDKFGWTTRSSQLYEDWMLRIGSPLFHFGMLGVVGGQQVGVVTSGTQTPYLKKADGMAYVPPALKVPGTELEMDIRGRRAKAVVVPMPFYKREKKG